MELKLPNKNSYDYQFIKIIDEKINNHLSINNGARIDDYDFRTLNKKNGGNYDEDVLRRRKKDYLKLLQDYGYLIITSETNDAVRRTGILIEEVYQKEAEQAKQIQKQKDAEELDKKSKLFQTITSIVSAFCAVVSVLVLLSSNQPVKTIEIKYNKLQHEIKTLQTRIDTLQIELQHLKEKPTPQVQSK